MDPGSLHPIETYDHWMLPELMWGIQKDVDAANQWFVLEFWYTKNAFWIGNCIVPTREAAVAFIEGWLHDEVSNSADEVIDRIFGD